jgi:hypothetical protein
LTKTPATSRYSSGDRRFLFDDRGQDQGLLGARERQALLAVRPELGQEPGHVAPHPLDDLGTGRAACEHVGFGQEFALARQRIRHVADQHRVPLDHRQGLDRAQAFGNGQRVQDDLAALQDVEHAARADAGGNAELAGAQPAVAPDHAGRDAEEPCVLDHAGSFEARGDTGKAAAAGKVDDLLLGQRPRCVEVALEQPPAAAKRQDGEDDERQRAGQESAQPDHGNPRPRLRSCRDG